MLPPYGRAERTMRLARRIERHPDEAPASLSRVLVDPLLRDSRPCGLCPRIRRHAGERSRNARLLVVAAGAPRLSGAVAAIARNGKVAYLRATGFRDLAKTSPLQSDSIFWIASMSKPVTSVAALMLVEEGKLDLAAPVAQYLPEFKDTMVAVETTDPVSAEKRRTLEPQKRAMIVEDL